MKGHCLCGAVRFTISGPLKWTGYCHCESCRRNCSAPVTAFLGVADGDWAWTGAAPATYSHSDHATRSFCARCGTPMAYATTKLPAETHFYAAALENPEDYRPAQHFFISEALSWLHIEDDLPRKG